MFDQLRTTIRKYFNPSQPLPAGTHHFQSPADAQRPFRLHLRLEPDGHGLLIVNAKTVLHLNPTAAEYAYYLVKETPPEETARSMAKRYRVSHDQALADYQDLTQKIQTLVTTPDLDPATYLDFDRRDPYSTDLSAPYRLDCAITYRLPINEDAASAPVERVKQELTTEQWKTLLSKAWDAGIPHVVFTGGEPTLRPDLPDLITCAQSLGQVSGLLTDGLALADPDYLNSLLKTGLDHILFVLQPDQPQSWQALEKTMAADIFTTVHLTITDEVLPMLTSVLDRLVKIDAHTVSLSASRPELAPELKIAQQGLSDRHLNMVWDLPVPYSNLHPVAFEKDESMPDGAGQAWLYVEPDGDVLPAQGVNNVLGNLLEEPWETIWQAARAHVKPAQI